MTMASVLPDVQMMEEESVYQWYKFHGLRFEHAGENHYVFTYRYSICVN